MIIGIPKEIKNQENRVGMTPAGVKELANAGHTLYVEHNAGIGIGHGDDHYEEAGAKIVDDPQKIFEAAELIIKVKEPQENECKMLRKDQILFTYLHLAASPSTTELLQDSGCIAIAYETVTRKAGGLPLLVPMSAVAGRLSIQMGMQSLLTINSGSGILLSGVPGVRPANVLVIGGGVVGRNAAVIAHGVGARVTVLDKSVDCLHYIDELFHGEVNTLYSNEDNVETCMAQSDLVIGSVLIPGAAAPKIVKKKHLALMSQGSVIVDVAIDQGGCTETSRPTSHDNPTYIEDGVVHYCVPNIPGVVPKTSTYALVNATLPFALKLAQHGADEALKADPHLMDGLNVYKAKITNKAVAEAVQGNLSHSEFVEPLVAIG